MPHKCPFGAVALKQEKLRKRKNTKATTTTTTNLDPVKVDQKYVQGQK